MNPQRLVAAVAALAIGFGVTLVGVRVADDDPTVTTDLDRDEDADDRGGSEPAEQQAEIAEPTPAAEAPVPPPPATEAADPEVGEQSETSATRPPSTASESTDPAATTPASSGTSATLECATTLALTISSESQPFDILVEQVFAEGWSGVSADGEIFTVLELADRAPELSLGDPTGVFRAEVTNVEVVDRFVKIELDPNDDYQRLAFSEQCDELGDYIVDDDPSTTPTAFFLPCRVDLRPLFEAVLKATAAFQFLTNVEGVTSLDELTDAEIVLYASAGVLDEIGGRGVDTYLEEVSVRADGIGRFDEECPALLSAVGDRFDDPQSFLCLAAQLADGEGFVEYLMEKNVAGDECSYDAIRTDEEGDG